MHWAAFFSSLGSLATAAALAVGYRGLRQQRRQFSLQQSADGRSRLLQAAMQIRHYTIAMARPLRPADAPTPPIPSTEDWIVLQSRLISGGAVFLAQDASQLEQHLMAFQQALNFQQDAIKEMERTRPTGPVETPSSEHMQARAQRDNAAQARNCTAEYLLRLIGVIERRIQEDTTRLADDRIVTTWIADQWQRLCSGRRIGGWRLSGAQRPGTAPSPARNQPSATEESQSGAHPGHTQTPTPTQGQQPTDVEAPRSPESPTTRPQAPKPPVAPTT